MAAMSSILPTLDRLSEPESASPLFKHFDKEAGQAQKRWHEKFTGSLYALGAIALLSTVAGISSWLKKLFTWSDETTRWFDIVVVILAIAAVGLELFYQRKLKKQRNSWTSARGKAESIRGLVWFYLFDLRVPSAITDSRSARVDDNEWKQIIHNRTSGIGDATGTSEVEPTQALIDLRLQAQQLSLEEKLRHYVKYRIDNQRNYFLKQANRHKKRLKRFHFLINLLLIVAIIWGVVRVIFTLMNSKNGILFFNSLNFFPFLVTLIALLKAYIESEDIEPLSERYLEMARRIGRYKETSSPSSVSAISFEQFVHDSELILHEETAEWSTRHSEPPVRSISIGFVGKRRLPSEEALRDALQEVFDKLEDEFPGRNFVGVSSLAMGADTVFVEVVAQRGKSFFTERPKYTQHILLPASEAEFFLPSDFQLNEDEPFSVVDSRLGRAYACLNSQVVGGKIDFPSTHAERDERFAETAVAIVDECQTLIVACTRDERVAALDSFSTTEFLRGGSAETLRIAREKGKHIFIIEVDAPVDVNGRLPITELVEV